jgi:hypothetical protein
MTYITAKKKHILLLFICEYQQQEECKTMLPKSGMLVLTS